MTSSTADAPTVTDRFRAARDLLVDLREDYDRAVAEFTFPDVGDRWNWAIDWFDAIARGNDKPALTIVEQDESVQTVTFDEMAHLTAGYSYWLFDDYRLHPENGNWPQRLGALPALWGKYSFPRLDQPAWRASNVYAIGDQFLYFSGNDAGTVLNINADVMACALASRLPGCDLVIAGTTAGVLDDAGATISTLEATEVDSLIASGTATAGMIAKLSACRSALDAGVARVRIVVGRLLDCHHGIDHVRGTTLVAVHHAAAGEVRRPVTA